MATTDKHIVNGTYVMVELPEIHSRIRLFPKKVFLPAVKPFVIVSEFVRVGVLGDQVHGVIPSMVATDVVLIHESLTREVP